jgi:hypothetical protein
VIKGRYWKDDLTYEGLEGAIGTVFKEEINKLI